jgi:hypothetical protein
MTDAEARLQSPVLLPILHRCSDEQATDENRGQDDEKDENDRGRGVHASKSFPPKRISSPTSHPAARPPRRTSPRIRSRSRSCMKIEYVHPRVQLRAGAATDGAKQTALDVPIARRY